MTFPEVAGVTFGTPPFAAGENITLNEDGSVATVDLAPGTDVDVSLTNEALLGSISIVKALEGGAADQVDAAKTYSVTAHIDTSALGEDFPAQPDRTVELTVGEPVVIDNLPLGAVVTFTEIVPEVDDLFTWGEPVFNPESITITAEHASEPAEVVVTNAVERTLSTFSVVKNVTGEQAENPAVPESVTVTATWAQDGEDFEEVLTVPTDGTPVALGHDLYIGTEVTLTESPLEDGSSIAWGSPVWSGTGVTVDGDSAIVTVERIADAQVNLENHAATSTAGISIIKGIAGEAAAEVDDSTEFPVTATWTDADGVEQSKNLTINALEPTSLGEELPAGTVVTIAEGAQPGFDTVVWGEIVINGDGVTDLGDGVAEIVVSDQQGDMTLATVTNEATWAPGTFSISKDVTGVLIDNPDVPESVTVTASWIEGEEIFTEQITVATDGTVTAFGKDLSHGTEVILTEEDVANGAAFSWDAPIWNAEGIVLNEDGTATITIGAANETQVSLTNNASESFGTLTVVKSLSGDGKSEVSGDTKFPITATWTDILGEEHVVEIEVSANQPAAIENLPLGTEVALTEGNTDLRDNVKWNGATWTAEDDNVAIDGEGNEIVVIVTGDAGTEASINLDNEIEKLPDLASTGASFITAGLIALALVGIGGGALLISRRRQAQA